MNEKVDGMLYLLETEAGRNEVLLEIVDSIRELIMGYNYEDAAMRATNLSDFILALAEEDDRDGHHE